MDVTKIKDLDPEVLDLCVALNKLPGIMTIESCCGHGENPYRIWFVIEDDDLDKLPAALYYFDRCHCGLPDWKVVVTTDCAMSPVHFMIEGPTGETAYDGSKKISKLIEKYVSESKDEDHEGEEPALSVDLHIVGITTEELQGLTKLKDSPNLSDTTKDLITRLEKHLNEEE